MIATAFRAVQIASLCVAGLLVSGCGRDRAAGDREAGSEPADSPSVGAPGDPGSGSPPAPGEPGTYVYTCANGYTFAVDFAGDSAILELVTREHALPRVPAASGARYEAGDVVFWAQGEGAMLDAGPSRHRGCEAERAGSPWEKARLLGIELRAIGQEPGWIVDVHPDRWIRYLGDYGETRIAFPPAPPQPDSTSITYTTEAGDHALEIVFTRAPCRDAMSGEPFELTVSVRVDTRMLDGCGRRLSEP